MRTCTTIISELMWAKVVFSLILIRKADDAVCYDLSIYDDCLGVDLQTWP